MTTINHINDVLPHLVDGFIVMDKGDYKVIDYVHIGAGFDSHPVLLECRGLVFDKNGILIRRPLHKFFNLGERGITSDMIDWSRPHVITDKLDGSMIAPFILNGEVRFGTRAGITEHSLRCEEKHLTEEIIKCIKSLANLNATAIFEWTSPENQIVLQYPESKISLLAIRGNENGVYLNRNLLIEWAIAMNVPLVEQVRPEIIELVYDAQGIEGVVIHFTDDDTFIKVKSDEYVRAHRAVSYLDREDMVLDLVLHNQYDDILPLLTIDKQQKLSEYAAKVFIEVNQLAYRLESIVYHARNSGIDRKTFALEIAAQADERIRSCYFSILDGKKALDVVKEKVLKNPSILKNRW